MGLKTVSPRHAVVGVVALLYGVIALVFAFHVGSPEQLKRISGHSLTVTALGAGIACMLRSRSVADPRTRTAWRLLGAGAMSWGLGQVVTFLYEVVLEAEVPFPSLADLGYLLAVPLFGAGLLCLTGPAGHLAARLRAVVDGLLISCAVLLVSWVSVLGPVAHSSQDSLLSKVILIAYPAGDVALVTLVAYVLLRVRATGVRPHGAGGRDRGGGRRVRDRGQRLRLPQPRRRLRLRQRDRRRLAGRVHGPVPRRDLPPAARRTRPGPRPGRSGCCCPTSSSSSP